MKITYDPAKREKTLAERELDFEDAPEIFAGITLTLEDDRQDYGEVRYQTYGRLGERLVMLIWTERDGARHIISMRKCNEREQARYGEQLDRSG